MPVERVLLVGLGSIGTRHARLIRRLLPDAELGVLRRRPGRGPFDLGVDRWFTEFDDALTFRPDIAVIASPAPCHLDSALPLALAGVHLFIEKPVAAEPRGVPALIEACRSSGVRLMIGYNLRFLPSLNRARELLNDGRIGRVFGVRADVGQYLPSWRPAADYRTTVSASRALGGGVLLELSHDIDYLRWLFGEVTWVQAVIRRQSALAIDVEDFAVLTMGLAHSETGTECIASLQMDMLRVDTTRSFVAIGEDASLRWNGMAGTVELWTKASGQWESVFSAGNERDRSYLLEWQHFLACLAAGQQPIASGDDGLAVLRVTEAARASAAAGCVIRIDGEPYR
jgi:predicted dehydrogenase